MRGFVSDEVEYIGRCQHFCYTSFTMYFVAENSLKIIILLIIIILLFTLSQMDF